MDVKLVHVWAAYQIPDWRVGCPFLIVLISSGMDGRSRYVNLEFPLFTCIVKQFFVVCLNMQPAP